MSKDTIEIREWVHRPPMFVRASALDHDDPDHPYNQAKAQGVKPEDFGLVHPLTERFASWTRSQLVDRIMELEGELRAQGAPR